MKQDKQVVQTKDSSDLQKPTKDQAKSKEQQLTDIERFNKARRALREYWDKPYFFISLFFLY